MSPISATPGEEVLIRKIQELVGNTPVYLVGGAVRDHLLGYKWCDLDFVLQEDEVRSLAKKIANEFRGSYYILDDKRNTARVILGSDEQRMVLDFTAFRGGSLESDLSGRDFTINSMALEVHKPEKMIDPLHGARDLKDRILKPCGLSAFLDDPVRTMRAVRMSVSFGLRMDQGTTTLLKQAVNKLGEVSIERRRDELFHMLESPRVAASIRLLDHFQILPFILPEIGASKGSYSDSPIQDDQFEHSMAVVESLERLYSILIKPYQEETASSSLVIGSAVLHLGRFRENLAYHFDQRLVVDRSRLGLLMLAGLYSRIGGISLNPPGGTVNEQGMTKDRDQVRQAVDRARALALSQSEVDLVRTVLFHYPRVHALAKNSGDLARIDVFRYFRNSNRLGIDACILALADLMATYKAALPQDQWLGELAAARALLEGWFEQRAEVVDPPILLTGEDLMARYHLKPGPFIGEALAYLKEAQASGEVTSRAEALARFEHWRAAYRTDMKGD